MKSIIAWGRRTTPLAAVFLIRLVVGGVFLVEGRLKFMFPDELAAGRFAKIGLPAPGFFGPFVGGVEVVCGALLILGLLTRLAALPLLIDISVALISTKLTVLLGHGFGPFSVMKAPHYGLLGMIHEGRTDLAMFFGLLFLLVVGAGGISFDAAFGKRSG
jgi:putative oxidoreductase